MKKLLASILLTTTLGFVSTTTALAADKRVKITNKSELEVVRLYGSRSDINDWEENILGKETLPQNYSVIIDFEDDKSNCLYDIKAIFNDGHFAVLMNVNVCEKYQINIK